MSNLSFAAIIAGVEFWPINRVSAAHHFFCNIDAIDKALSDDTLVAGWCGSAVAASAVVDLDTLHFLAGDKLGHLRRRFGAINAAETCRDYLIAHMQLNRVHVLLCSVAIW
jgi:hypothetical protein